ncbi:MAG: hypothetical protein OSJ70_04925 [Bacilli bacterium]|nr:hypothetical protein [Bacilli bacterium]
MEKRLLESRYKQILEDRAKNKEETLKYRIDSVLRVLHYLENNIKDEYLKTLTTHCCNKLSGNIDGIELELKENKE